MRLKYIITIFCIYILNVNCYKPLQDDNNYEYTYREESIGNTRVYEHDNDNGYTIVTETITSKETIDNITTYKIFAVAINPKWVNTTEYFQKCYKKDPVWCESDGVHLDSFMEIKKGKKYYVILAYNKLEEKDWIREVGEINSEKPLKQILNERKPLESIEVFEITGIYKVNKKHCYAMTERHYYISGNDYYEYSRWYCDKYGLIAEFDEHDMEKKLFKAKIDGIQLDQDEIESIVSTIEWHWLKERMQKIFNELNL